MQASESVDAEPVPEAEKKQPELPLVKEKVSFSGFELAPSSTNIGHKIEPSCENVEPLEIAISNTGKVLEFVDILNLDQLIYFPFFLFFFCDYGNSFRCCCILKLSLLLINISHRSKSSHLR